MNGTNQLLDRIEIALKNSTTGALLPVYINVYDNTLSRRWLAALDDLLLNCRHLEKNFCFLGFPDGPRSGELVVAEINRSIQAIQTSGLEYALDDYFTLANSINEDLSINHDHFNRLHRYFEDLQGTSGHMSPHYTAADDRTRWHIRQLNLLCHEFETWALSNRKVHTAPEWVRPSQLMCWLGAPRFKLEPEDLDLFGIETINRSLGGVYVGVNKAVGKHHWEVFQDEGKHGVMLDELTTTAMRGQTEAAGDFDIEWANNPGAYEWQRQRLAEFRSWLRANGLDPEDPTLTIGHPRVAQVDLHASFGTADYRYIWAQLSNHLDVYSIKTSQATATYKYTWSDLDYMDLQIAALKG
jgi:hypothetical protein